MRFACWITRATDTHLKYATIIFPGQKWLSERASMLRCTYIACRVFSCRRQLLQCNRWRKVSPSGDKLMCSDVTGNLLTSNFVVSFSITWKLNEIISRLPFCHVTPCSLVNRNQLYILVGPYPQHSRSREPDLTQWPPFCILQ